MSRTCCFGFRQRHHHRQPAGRPTARRIRTAARPRARGAARAPAAAPTARCTTSRCRSRSIGISALLVMRAVYARAGVPCERVDAAVIVAVRRSAGGCQVRTTQGIMLPERRGAVCHTKRCARIPQSKANHHAHQHQPPRAARPLPRHRPHPRALRPDLRAPARRLGRRRDQDRIAARHGTRRQLGRQAARPGLSEPASQQARDDAQPEGSGRRCRFSASSPTAPTWWSRISAPT